MGIDKPSFSYEGLGLFFRDFFLMSSAMHKDFIRDGRAPIPVKQCTSRAMSANRAKNTSPERIFRKLLWQEGIRGYRLHWKNAPGKPDLAFPKRKIAIFINGCFWHRCPYCKPGLPKTHLIFWEQKFEKNKLRDKIKTEILRKNGWKVLTIWECQIKKRPLQLIELKDYY